MRVAERLFTKVKAKENCNNHFSIQVLAVIGASFPVSE